MTLAAIALSVISINVDAIVSTDWPEKFPFVFSNKPEGARALLATVAGSMITVAGVTFSLTLLAVSHATGQFGPRLLNNFMRDRGNQVTLGTFTSTFIYCLMVLRTVRAAATPSGEDNVEDLAAAFVPHISVTIALILTLCSVAVLIYFMHHVPESIRVSKVLSGVGRTLIDQISDLFPETIAETQPTDRDVKPAKEVPRQFNDDAVVIGAVSNGYIQAVAESELLALAVENDLLVELIARPGDFVCEGQPLLRVGPSSQASDDVRNSLSQTYATGSHATSDQNAMFLVGQLVEVAQRAMSPGINDPNTAVSCIDWLQAGLIAMTRRKDPEKYRYDSDGELRIFSDAIDFKEFCDVAFDQLRPCVALERNVSIRMMTMLKEVKRITKDEQRTAILDRHAQRLLSAAAESSQAKVDLEDLRTVWESD